ncbi:hypothetical protein ANN_26072 [Periplaneta americana]|uniref:Uncharacterized protein n=1 Tax=Periplaneta americana TaxID=6978 RepID=A0ABQ8S4X8_PERAM|nr:hypothetical protein ANN_26072 [Periplaneta americana]
MLMTADIELVHSHPKWQQVPLTGQCAQGHTPETRSASVLLLTQWEDCWRDVLSGSLFRDAMDFFVYSETFLPQVIGNPVISEVPQCLAKRTGTQDVGRQQSLKCTKGKRCSHVCPVVQQEEVESIPASSHECTMVHCVLRGTARHSDLKNQKRDDEERMMGEGRKWKDEWGSNRLIKLPDIHP